jgi:hypothetical protein
MAHYALLDENNIVTQVITGKDEHELDNEGNVVDWEKSYSEVTGQVCKRTSYNTYANKHLLGGTPFRKNYAGIDFYYDEDWDAFRPPQPFPSWKLDYETFQWVPPIPMPSTPEDADYGWKWGEINQEWIKIQYTN